MRSQLFQREEVADAAWERTVIFPAGIPGFPALRRFRLISDPEFNPPFELLASDEEPNVGFYLVDPTLVDEDYRPDVPDADLQALLLRPNDELCLRAIVSVGEDATSTTANLAAPVVLNLTAGLGIQAILEGPAYSLRTPLVVE